MVKSSEALLVPTLIRTSPVAWQKTYEYIRTRETFAVNSVLSGNITLYIRKN